MEGKHRNANSFKEIESILANASGTDCLVWQNLTGKRVVYPVDEVLYDKEQKTFKFKLKPQETSIDEKEFVYVKFDYRETMLKTKIEKLKGNWLYIKYPSQDHVKTVELRREKRTEFKLDDEVLITLEIKNIDTQAKDHVLKFQILDIAEGGISLLVSNFNKAFVESSKELTLTHIGDTLLKKPIKLNMCYMHNYRHKVRGKLHFANRAGFKLGESFSVEDLLEFLRINEVATS